MAEPPSAAPPASTPSATTPALTDTIPNFISEAVSPATGEKFLRFFLDATPPVLLPADQLIEILTVSIGQIVPMFQMPAWVMGVYNWRGEVLWIVDLNHFLGLTPWYQQRGYVSKHTVIVLRTQTHSTGSADENTVAVGLVVNRVEDMVMLNPDEIASPLLLNSIPGIEPFLQGCWQPAEHDVNLVLNSSAIAQAMSV